MDQQMNVKNEIINMEPVFVTAPTGRNGITLIQRLLNSSHDIIVYGENSHLVSVIPHQVNAIIPFMNNKKELDQAFEHFRNGNVEGWTSNLWPGVMRYVGITLENAYRYYEYYAEFSKDNGFSQWGIKNPLTGPKMVQNIRTLLKRTRFILIYRNIFSVARSAKARNFIFNISQLGHFAQQWQDNLMPFLKKEIDRVLCIQYENLVQNPEPEIQKLELFGKVRGIDRSVMDRKINTFKGNTENGHSPDQYIDPVELSCEEVEIITDRTVQALEMTGYQP
jgi:hypothetical protein